MDIRRLRREVWISISLIQVVHELDRMILIKILSWTENCVAFEDRKQTNTSLVVMDIFSPLIIGKIENLYLLPIPLLKRPFW